MGVVMIVNENAVDIQLDVQTVVDNDDVVSIVPVSDGGEDRVRGEPASVEAVPVLLKDTKPSGSC